MIKWNGIDLFCGAGGTTTGIIQSKVATIVAAINHDSKAIESHAQNHPETKHHSEDIVLFDVDKLPTKVDFIWMSAECTHFSNAKGGEGRDADSRTLSEQIYRYEEHCNPNYIIVENVREFLSWGPLTEKRDKAGNIIYKNGSPVMVPSVDENKQGEYYNKWIAELKRRGYVNYRYKLLNSADFGAYTSRLRYFGIFAKQGFPVRFPSPTHNKKGVAGLEKWKAVRAVLDLNDEGKCIFDRKKPLSEKTLARIYAGLQKYVAGGDDSFITKWLGNNTKTGINNGVGLDSPAPVITTQNRLGLVQTNQAFITQRYTGKNRNLSIESPCPTLTTRQPNEVVQVQSVQPKLSFLTKYYSGKPEYKSISVEGPAGAITCVDGHSLIQTSFLTKFYNGDHNHSSIEAPAGTITTKDRLSIITAESDPEAFMLKFNNNEDARSLNNPCPTLTTKDKFGLAFIQKFYNGSHNHSSVEEPAGTLTTAPKLSLVEAYFLDKQYSGDANHSSIEEPAGTLTVNPKLSLIEAKGYIMDGQFNNVGSSLTNPCPTLVASRRHHYLVNAQYTSAGSSVKVPAPTLIATMGKRPLSLVSANGGEYNLIADQPGDSEYTLKIKAFMREYRISSIKMRMLKVLELLKIQGFPEGYVLKGNQTDQKKFIGNSVVPIIAQKIIEALYEAYYTLCELEAA